jgi:hypothetical protein
MGFETCTPASKLPMARRFVEPLWKKKILWKLQIPSYYNLVYSFFWGGWLVVICGNCKLKYISIREILHVLMWDLQYFFLRWVQQRLIYPVPKDEETLILWNFRDYPLNDTTSKDCNHKNAFQFLISYIPCTMFYYILLFTNCSALHCTVFLHSHGRSCIYKSEEIERRARQSINKGITRFNIY